MAKYIHIDQSTLDAYVNILLEFAVSIDPHINEVEAKELMIEHLTLNKLTAQAASFMGHLVKATACRTKVTH